VKCSAWKAWKVVGDEMIPTETCQNEAVVLLSHKPHWEDIPYCYNCGGWMMSASAMFGLPFEVKELSADNLP